MDMDTVTSLEDTRAVPSAPRHAAPDPEPVAAEQEPRAPREHGFRVSHVLGHPDPEDVPDKPSLLSRALGPLKRAWAVLSQPKVAGVLIGGLGVLILLLLGYVYVFTPLSAARAQHTLLAEITSQPIKTYQLAEGKLPAEGSPMAILEIPALHLDQAVVQGTTAQDLRQGPGHMPTSSLPGQRGNAVIAARRATFGAPFGSIGSMKKGQTITVVDGLGKFEYRVVGVVSAQGGKHDVVTQTKANQLTLVTAGSGFWPQGRLAVVATLVGKPFGVLPQTHFHATTAELGLAGDPVSGLLFVLWSLGFFAILSLAAWLLRNWDQPVVVLMLSVPVLLIVALFVCESLVGALPATV